MSLIMQKLTQQEEEAMRYVWHLQGGFIKDILACYPPPSPPYTTVASIIQNLKRKGYVRIEREGNGYRYLPVVSEAEYKRTFLSGFVQEYFRNSYKELVSFFARDQKLSGDDLKDILRMIEEEKDK